MSTSNLGWMQPEEVFADGPSFFWTVLARPPVYQPKPEGRAVPDE